jgi:hypothetical protein
VHSGRNRSTSAHTQGHLRLGGAVSRKASLRDEFLDEMLIDGVVLRGMAKGMASRTPEVVLGRAVTYGVSPAKELLYPMILLRSGNVTGRAFLKKMLSLDLNSTGACPRRSPWSRIGPRQIGRQATWRCKADKRPREIDTSRHDMYLHFLLHLESSISTMAQFCTTVCMTIRPRSLACRGELPCGYIHFISLKPARPISIRCAAEVYD